MRLTTTLACLGWLTAAALAQDDEEEETPSAWVNPGPSTNEDERNNPVVEVGDEYVLEWTTASDQVTIALGQWWPDIREDDEPIWDILPDYSETRFTWNVTLEDVNERYLNESVIEMYFALIDDNGRTFSRNFNITVPEEEEEPEPSPSETNEPEDDGDSGGLSTGATAGIAVGASVGGLALIGGLIFLWWRKRKGGAGAGGAASGGDGTAATSPQSQMQHPMSPATVYQQQQQPMLQEHYKPAVYEQNSMYGSPPPQGYAQPMQYGYVQQPHQPQPGVAPYGSPSPPTTQIYEAPSTTAETRVIHEAP